ncbi:hypothetical protein GIB67_020337, partial [Kingdonia uniflora]
MHIFENVNGDQFYYQGLLEYIMSDVAWINKVILPGSGIVVKTPCAVPIEVMPPPLIQQPNVVMMEPYEGPPICPTSQVEVEAPVNAETEAGVGLGREASNDEKEVDEVDAGNRWAETNPDSLDTEEGLAKCSKDLQSIKWKSSLVMFKPKNHLLPPPLVRGAGRPRKQRIPYQDEEKRQKRCRKCGSYGHNKKNCKGAPAIPRPRVVRAPKRVDTNVSMARHMSSVGLPPAIPNMRGRGSGGIGCGDGRCSRGTRQTQDTKAARPTQASLFPRKTRASTYQVHAL